MSKIDRVLWGILGLGVLSGGIYYFFGRGSSITSLLSSPKKTCGPQGLLDNISIGMIAFQQYQGMNEDNRLYYISYFKDMSTSQKDSYLRYYYNATPNQKCIVLQHLENSP